MTAPRVEGIDYVIEVPDPANFHDAHTIDTFGRDGFAAALATYLDTSKRTPGARLLKILDCGWVMTPVLGYVQTRARRAKVGNRRTERGRFVIGWNRIEPPDRGSRYYRIDDHEREAMVPGRTIVHSSVGRIR